MSEDLLATYFGDNGDLIFQAMNGTIKAGERVLNWFNGCFFESYAVIDGSGYHPYMLRLPDQFQSAWQRITCPTCHLTYTHQHVFTPGASKPRAVVS